MELSPEQSISYITQSRDDHAPLIESSSFLVFSLSTDIVTSYAIIHSANTYLHPLWPFLCCAS